MTLHDMTGEARRGRNRALQVDARAGGQVAQVGERQCFGSEVGGEGIRREIERGEADAVHRDARSLLGIRQNGGATDAQARSRRAALERGEGSEFLNDSRKHLFPARPRPQTHWERWDAGARRETGWHRSGGGVRFLPPRAATACRPESWARNKNRSCRRRPTQTPTN